MKKVILASVCILFFAVVFSALVPTHIYAQAPGSLKFSSGGPEFTFQIPIPGADPSFPLCEPKSGGVLECSGIAYYVSVLYQWLVGIAAILAVLAIAWGGVQWLISRGESGKIQEARKIIGNAFIGLILALGSYGILFTINPKFVQFAPLEIKAIQPISLTIEGIDGASGRPGLAPVIEGTTKTPGKCGIAGVGNTIGGSTTTTAAGKATAVTITEKDCPQKKLTRASVGPAGASSFNKIEWYDLEKPFDANKRNNCINDSAVGVEVLSIVEKYIVANMSGRFDDDIPTLIHENIHKINCEVGFVVNGQEGLYVGEAKAMKLKNSSKKVADVIPKVPDSIIKINSGLFNTYLGNARMHTNSVLALLDELTAYTLSAKAGRELEKRKLLDARVAINDESNIVGMIVYALSAAVIIDKEYLNEEPQFQQALQYLIQAGMSVYKKSSARTVSSVKMLDALKSETDEKTTALRDLARSWYTSSWTETWLGFK